MATERKQTSDRPAGQQERTGEKKAGENREKKSGKENREKKSGGQGGQGGQGSQSGRRS